MSLDRVKWETSSTQFLKWIQWIKQDANEFHPEYHYWAQIAAEIVRSRLEDPSKVKDDDYIIKFTFAKAGEEAKPALTKEEATILAKQRHRHLFRKSRRK